VFSGNNSGSRRFTYFYFNPTNVDSRTSLSIYDISVDILRGVALVIVKHYRGDILAARKYQLPTTWRGICHLLAMYETTSANVSGKNLTTLSLLNVFS
jgi:hypothetical protein